ncbi:unnamed protein product, partial [Ectocarpus sp. 12 AP-2014]
PEPEEFLDQVLHEVGEVRGPSSASARAAATAAASAEGGTGGDAGSGGSGGGGGGGGATKYSLAAAAACEYDPTFVRLNRTEHQAAVETVARKRKAAAASSAAAPGTTLPCPLVGPPPPAHTTFLPVRRGLLYSPVVMSTVRIVLSSYADKTPGKFSDLLLARTLQIITLQLHGLQEDPADQELQGTEGGRSSGATGGASASVSSGGVEETKSSGGGGGGRSSSSSNNHEAAYFASVLLRQEGSVGGGERNSLDASWVLTEGTSGDGDDGGRTVSGSGGGVASVCEALGRVAHTHGALGTLFEDGLQWIVREFARRSPACRE